MHTLPHLRRHHPFSVHLASFLHFLFMRFSLLTAQSKPLSIIQGVSMSSQMVQEVVGVWVGFEVGDEVLACVGFEVGDEVLTWVGFEVGDEVSTCLGTHAV